MRRTWVAMGALSTLLALSACGSDDPASPFDPGDDEVPAGSGAMVTVTFDISGGVTIQGSVTDVVPSVGLETPTCAAYAAGFPQPDGKTSYPVPSLLTAGPVDGHQVTVEAFVEDYRGPGTYGGDELSGFGNEANIMVDSQQQYTILLDVTESELVTDGNGGGTWSFTNLVARSDTAEPGVDGSISWTCG